MRIILLLLFLLPLSVTKAQHYATVRFGYANPGQILNPTTYDKNNFVFGFTYYKGLIETKGITWKLGGGFDAVLGKSHKYTLQSGNLTLKNVLCPLYLSTRLDYDKLQLKPFVEYSIGLLFSGPAESFKEKTTLSNQGNSSSQNSNSSQDKQAGFGMISGVQLFTVGLLYPISKSCDIEISSTYKLGGAINFLDYSKVHPMGDNLLVEGINNVSKMDMYYFRVGLHFKFNVTNSTNYTKTPPSNTNNNNSQNKQSNRRSRLITR